MTRTQQAADAPAGRLPASLLRIIAVVTMGALMMQLDLTMTNIATRTWLREFHSTLSVLQWVGTGYMLAMVVTIPLAGWALERFGARAVWTACITLFLGGSVLCGAAWSPGSLIAFRILQGLGAGMVLPVGQTVLVQAAGPERLNRAMAALGVPAMLGPVLGPVLGGVLVDDLNWRWIFYVNVPVCLAALALSRRAMPADRVPGDTRLDLTGLALLSPGCAAVVLGLAQTGSYGGFGDGHVLVPLAVGAALLAAFAVNALRTSRVPLIDLRLFGRRPFASASASIFVSGFVLFGAMGALPLYYQLARGDSAQHAGALLIPMGIGMGLSLMISGRLADHVPPRTIALVGLLCTALGTSVYTQVAVGTSDLLLSGAQVLSGAGIGATLVPIMSSAYRGLEPAAVPRASTSIRIMQQLGGSFGSAVLLIVTQHQLSGHARTPAGLAAAFGATFWWILAFTAVLLLPVLFLPGRNPQRPAPQPPGPLAQDPLAQDPQTQDPQAG
ncbi:DHA2 family efflux MFS transporter permease subunit [Actinomadura scrupuli]|uniref:DHA2 family efflux MFS transporter permease subunit n=1 Tax=Actinomadura scrupuli TaxID=559629 RepID=UPI003D96FFEB